MGKEMKIIEGRKENTLKKTWRSPPPPHTGTRDMWRTHRHRHGGAHTGRVRGRAACHSGRSPGTRRGDPTQLRPKKGIKKRFKYVPKKSDCGFQMELI